MSKTTIRKRVALTATTALFAGVLTVTSVPVASATHPNAGGSTFNAALGTVDASMGVSVVASSTTSAAMPTDLAGTSATQKGLLSKDTSSGTAQTATILAGGQVAFYAKVTTSSAFTATGGSFSSAGNFTNTAYSSSVYNSSNTQVVIPFTALHANSTSTGVGTLWTAPTTAGTYTVSLLTGNYTNSSGQKVIPDIDNLPPTLSGRITVTVVAASAGGAYSSAYSACKTTAYLAGETATTVTNVDSTYAPIDGESMAIAVKLRDAYNQNLSAGNLVASATNGALLSWGTTAGTVTATPLAGTGSTVVAYRAGSLDALLVSQPTAGSPLTTTVTITYNGTTVCTKTVSIAGKVASLEVSAIQTQDLSKATHTTDLDESGRTTGQLFRVVAKDSAGNRIATSGLGTFSADSAALAAASPTVTAVSVAHSATSTSSSSNYSSSTGLYTCGATAGSAKMKLKFTTTSTGEAVTSPEFTLRCADAPYTYTASWDKASYVQGELATLTVKFLDSKGNPANNVDSFGYSSIVAPMMTAVSATGAASIADNAGVKTYTFTVGLTSGITAGTYTSIIDYSGLTAVAATKQTPTYKVSTGGDTTTNADVLKSIVALIASINKQIQALQKLILKR